MLLSNSALLTKGLPYLSSLNSLCPDDHVEVVHTLRICNESTITRHSSHRAHPSVGPWLQLASGVHDLKSHVAVTDTLPTPRGTRNRAVSLPRGTWLLIEGRFELAKGLSLRGRMLAWKETEMHLIVLIPTG